MFSYCFDPSGDRIFIYDNEIYELKLPAGAVRQLSNLRSKGIILNPDLNVMTIGKKIMVGTIIKQGGDIWVIEDE